MPLLHFDLVAGRTDDQLRALLDSAHAAMLEAFETPERDRYQVVTQHPPGEMVALDTGLGLERSSDLVIVRVTSRRRTDEMKQSFYRLLAENLQRDCGVAPEDLIVTIVENDAADWSFGLGRAQFVTGEL
jgi:phenylpyruvate tautomerase PptA (4-oxalocrotonate tautomerase family)